MKRSLNQCVCLLVAFTMLMLSMPVFAASECNVTVEYQKSDDGYSVKGIYDYTCDETLMAILAVYGEDSILKSVNAKEITEHTGTEIIDDVSADEGYKVKGMLWNKRNMESVADIAEKIVADDSGEEPTSSPTVTPSEEPTASPTVTPSEEPTAPPVDKKTAAITIKYVDEENNSLKADTVLSEQYTDGETYTVPNSLKTKFVIKNSDGLYNLYVINETTSQLTAPYAEEMTLILKFNNTTQYDYYEDFENYAVDTDKWHIKSGSGTADPTVETDNTKYICHTTGDGTTGGYMTFDEVDTTKKTVHITADVKFTEPSGSKKGNSQFAISNSSPSFNSSNITYGIKDSSTAGHIIAFEYNEGSTLKVNGNSLSTDFIGDWMHLEADVNFSDKSASITVTNNSGLSASFDNTTIYSSSFDSNIGSYYMRSAKTDGTVSADNITVKITGNGGEIVPNIKSVINHKSVYAFGDSIVYGHNDPKNSFMQLMANDYALSLNMMAKNGATIMPSSNQILTQVNNAPTDTPDFVVFDGYTNDAYGSSASDSFNADGTHTDITKCYGEVTAKGTTTFNTDTFCGSFENLIYTMKQKWQSSQLVFVTIHKSGARDLTVQEKLRELTMQICDKWDVKVVDMYTYKNANGNVLDTTDESQMSKYIINGAGSHPNVTACNEFYIPSIVSKLESLCASETPTASPTASPTVSPTATPTAIPTASPTATPTASPTASPTATPTAIPTASPTATPTATPNIVATYKFDFGADGNNAADGYTAITPDTVYDMSKSDTYAEGYGGLLGTEETSSADDVLSYDMDNRAIDGFSLVKGQQIILSSGGETSETNADSDYIAVPSKENYVPTTASEFEGRFPIRFSMKADRASYYTVTATLTNSSATENACVSLFSEKRQIVADDVTIKPNEKITFKFNVDIEDVYYKMYSASFNDDMLNISVSGKNAAISSIIVEKHGKIDGTIKGETADGGVNDGTTMWLCTDSTGCDYGATVPFFALQTYAGSGQAFVKYAPENIAISNQGERGLATVDNAHFNKCNLKPGDYLYVQYGHNETEGPDTYYSNLSKYYDMAEKSGANLIIASPVNRHQSSSLVDGQWQSDFTSYIEKAQQFVEEKIDAGKTNIAFVDLNKLYVEWMNTETARIKSVNSSLDEQGAMSFYYRSVKGSSIDGTHMNDAGADQAAYCFFMAAKEIVYAADSGSDDKYIKAQAEVVCPLTEGMKTKIGDSDIDNLPMTVSDEIINAGKAPNSYWDTVPTDVLEYDNSVAVDGVGAVKNNDGTMTISSVSMRLMNTIDTYAKAIITVTNDGTETKYYTESNYDCTGDTIGTVKTNNGFITSDKNHDDVTETDRVSTITVPKGAECTVQIVSCDDTWVVGDNPTKYSTIYNVYPEENVVFDENGDSVEGWNRLTKASTYSETVTEDTDGSKYIAISSNNADASGSKKNYGFYKELSEPIATGRYRVSFKTRFNAGTVRFALASTVKDASNPFSDKTYILGIKSGTIYMNEESVSIPTITNEDGTKDSKINATQWINVDGILDLSNGKILLSVAGSDYTEYDIADWQSNSSKTLPIKYFGIAGSTDGTATQADVKDIKIAQIPQGTVETKTVTVNINDSTMGTVTINGETATEKSVDISSAVTLKAAANDGYNFVSWTDESGNVLSEAQEYIIARLYDSVTVTANFEAVASDTVTWDFAEYADTNAVTADEDTVLQYEKSGETLNIALKANDQITTDGIVWADKTLKAQTDTVSGRYVEYTPSKNGTLTATFKGGTYASNKKPRMYIATDVTVGTTTKANLDDFTTGLVKNEATAANTDTKVSFDVTAGTTYYIFSYCYNSSAVKFTIPNITFTPTSE